MQMSNIRLGGLGLGGLSLGLALAVSSGAFADEHKDKTCGYCAKHKGEHHEKTPEEREARFQMMVQKLSLSKKQQTQIRAIMDKAHAEKKALRESKDVKGPEKFKKMQQIKFDKEDKIYGALSCDQRETFRKMERERRGERMKKHHKRHDGEHCQCSGGDHGKHKGKKGPKKDAKKGAKKSAGGSASN